MRHFMIKNCTCDGQLDDFDVILQTQLPQHNQMFSRKHYIAFDTAMRSVTNHNFTIPKPKSSLYKESLTYSGPVIWNTIPPEIKRSLTIGSFTSKLLS